MNSPNFNNDSNVDSGTCEDPVVVHNHGGIFQTCTGDTGQCRELEQKNPLTKDFSCPLNFDSIKLDGGLNKCETRCTTRFWFFTNCVEYCSNYVLY